MSSVSVSRISAISKMSFRNNPFLAGIMSETAAALFDPAVFGTGKLLQFSQNFRIHHHKVANRVVAKGIARGPVVYIFFYPAFKDFKVCRFKLFMQPLRPVAGNKRFFQKSRIAKAFRTNRKFRIWAFPLTSLKKSLLIFFTVAAFTPCTVTVSLK